jgi:prepilin-type N-terminal cleavage/methylation domain-containing protein
MSNSTSQNGFTLLEVLVATAILGLISLSFALGTAGSARYNAIAQSVTAATTLGHAKIEELTEKASTDPQLTSGSHSDPSSPLNADGTGGGIYTRTWTVTNNLPVTGLKTVQIQITWTLYGTAHVMNLYMVHSS